MKLSKYITVILLSTIFISGCNSIKETLSGKKKNNTDEFLVKKKNPLIMPSEFNVLPKPGNLNTDNKNENQKVSTFDIKKILNDKSETKTSSSQKKNNSLENSIIEKINKK